MKKNPVSDTYKSSLNFPKARRYYVFIKLGGKDSSDYTEEVNGIKMVKQWYWINTASLVNDLRNLNYLWGALWIVSSMLFRKWKNEYEGLCSIGLRIVV